MLYCCYNVFCVYTHFALLWRIIGIVAHGTALIITPDVTQPQEMADFLRGASSFVILSIQVERPGIRGSENPVINNYAIG